MPSSNSLQSFSETKLDFIVSWQLLRENWKAFIGTEIFSLIAFLVTVSILVGIYILLVMFVPSFTVTRFELGIFLFLFFCAFALIYAFFCSQYGLAYDVISSGDMFAEFKGSFTYFRLHWNNYLLLSFILGWVQTPFQPEAIIFYVLLRNSIITIDLFRTIEFFIILILRFLWFVLLINTLPSITSQGNLKQSFIENFRILRNYPKRLFTTWSIFFFIFYVPAFMLGLVNLLFFDILFGTFWWVLLIMFFIIAFLSSILIGAPMIALMATRIYNNVELNRYQFLNNPENQNNIHVPQKRGKLSRER
ncbi:MAG: hypothetical protein ACFFCZ_24515 [Promethearchaeota archaeon]